MCAGSQFNVGKIKHEIFSLKMFSSAGCLISRWGARGRFPGQLQRPIGIVVTKVSPNW